MEPIVPTLINSVKVGWHSGSRVTFADHEETEIIALQVLCQITENPPSLLTKSVEHVLFNRQEFKSGMNINYSALQEMNYPEQEQKEFRSGTKKIIANQHMDFTVKTIVWVGRSLFHRKSRVTFADHEETETSLYRSCVKSRRIPLLFRPEAENTCFSIGRNLKQN